MTSQRREAPASDDAGAEAVGALLSPVPPVLDVIGALVDASWEQTNSHRASEDEDEDRLRLIRTRRKKIRRVRRG